MGQRVHSHCAKLENITGKHDKIDAHFSLWLDMKGPQKRFIPHGSPEIGHLWNYNLRSDSNKALIQAIENETTFVLNKGNPLDTSGYRIQLIYWNIPSARTNSFLALMSCVLSEEDPFYGVKYSNLGHFWTWTRLSLGRIDKAYHVKQLIISVWLICVTGPTYLRRKSI